MRTRLRAVIAVTIVTGLVLIVVGRVVARSPEERDQIRDADRVAARFSKTYDRYISETATAIKDQHDEDTDGYPALLKLIKQRINAAPKVPTTGTTAYGRRHGTDYTSAVESRDLHLVPFAELGTFLQRSAMPDSSFIAAGKKLVKVNPSKLLGDTPVFSGAPLRDLVLPAFQKARTQLLKQDAPEGSELLALDLKTYADDAIGMTKDGADKIDGGKAFYFKLGQRPNELYRRLLDLESGIETEVSERVEVISAAE